MTEERLAELEALAEAATQGPWTRRLGVVKADTDAKICHFIRSNNAAFIGAAREAVPELIAEIRRLWEREEERDLDAWAMRTRE